MSLHLYFLGSPRIERDGRTIETDTRKAVALLAYLAVTGEYHSRDTLAALLWPEVSDERARAALRRTLSSLRSAIGGESLHVTRGGFSLNVDDVWCDVRVFESAVERAGRHQHTASPCPECLPLMEEAVGLYRDQFLSGFSLRDSAEFDDWQLLTTERLRRSHSTALAWLVGVYGRGGKYQRAIELGRRWLAADPLREEAHRWLMQLYSWSGSRNAALRQYRDAVRILDEELGVGPLPETTALYEAIREGRLEPPVEPTPSAPVAPRISEASHGPTQLLGRDTAWKALLGTYDAVGSSGRLAVIHGEPGIGKTRLVETFLAHCRERGALTAAATCYEGEANLAYAPIAASLRSLWRDPVAAERIKTVPPHSLSEVARLAPELGIHAPAAPALEITGPAARSRFFAGVSEAFSHLLSGDAPGILFLDDVHWADEASLDLLAYLARRLGDLPILLILSWGDTADDLIGENHRLRRLAVDAQRAGTGQLIRLARWRPSDVLELVMANEALRDNATEITDRLYRETEGLPYFVIEYLTAPADAPDRWAIPQSVRDLLAGRLAAVDETGRQLLQAAAVIGRSFEYTTLLEASGRSEDEVVGGLERLLGQGLIREVGAGAAGTGAVGAGAAGAGASRSEPAGELNYDFTHQQLRSLVYEETNLARRRLLHRRVAAALQGRARGPHGDAPAALIAGHFHLGGQDDMAAAFYYRAGLHARALYANREALDHFKTALALGYPDAAALHEAIGDLHTLLGEYQMALQAYESAAALAGDERLGRLERQLGQVYERRGNYELAESHYCVALSHYQQARQTEELARLTVDRSRVAYRTGDFATARSLATEALELARASSDVEAEAQAHNTLGILARQEGKAGGAREHFDRSLALAESAGVMAARVAALNNLARLLAAEDRNEEALALLEQAIALCTRQGDRHREAALYNHRADILHRAGQDEASMASLKQAVAIYAEIGMEAGDWQPEIWKLTEW